MRGVIFIALLIYSVFITLTFFAREGAEVKEMNQIRREAMQSDSLLQELRKSQREVAEYEMMVENLQDEIGSREDEISYLGHRYDRVKMKLDSLGVK